MCTLCSFSEKDTATVKSCFNFFETVTKNINKYDKELVILTIELVLFVLSSDIQLQSIHDEVSSKLEALLKATISKMFTRTYGGTSAENQVCKYVSTYNYNIVTSV